jgi:hypothetical protein
MGCSGVLLAIAGAALVGCAHPVELEPAAGAATGPGGKDTALAESAGVRVAVMGIWRGHPKDLWRIVTPVQVRIENHSGVPITTDYKSFALVAPSGFIARAASPFNVHKPGVMVPSYPFGGFYVAPQLETWYPGYPLWDRPFDPDAARFETELHWQKPLPSLDMLSMAMPVGVVDDHGTVTGYLYFQKPPRGTRDVTFVAELTNALTGAPVARISIPLIVTTR